MKKIYIIALSCLGLFSAKAQNIYLENFGQPVGSETISGYNGFQYTSPIEYTGTATINNENPAIGYPAASGFGNIYFTAASSQSLTISGINTTGFGTEDITLAFGYFKETSNQDIKLEVSTNGSDFTELEYTRYTDAGWERIRLLNAIPLSTNLRIRFTQTLDVTARIDDVTIKIESGCPLNFSTSYIICNDNTLSDDMYTAYLPFSGGGTQSYGITTTGGTISGDNPTTVESGTIEIINVEENVDFNVIVTGENCDYTTYVVGPQCKPAQELPFYESFNYPAGASLTSYPLWAESTNGQNLIIQEGSLNYDGMSAAHNSLKLDNGKDAFVPFTTTSSGGIYTSFIMEVEDISNIQADMEARQIGGLARAENFRDLKLRFFVQKNGDKFKLGISPGGIDITYTAASFDTGTNMFVILGYNFTSNELMAWINPDLDTVNSDTEPTITLTPATAPDNFGSLALWQNGVTINVDEIKIGTTVEDVTTSVLATQQNTINGFTMYPNPLNGSQLTILSNNNLQKDVVIFDMMGKQVVNATTQNNTINASLTPGIYLVKVTEEGNTTTKKLVVN